MVLPSIFFHFQYALSLCHVLVPSAAPANLSVVSSTSSSITIQWKAVPCEHRNGIITSYIIRLRSRDSNGSARGFREDYSVVNGEPRQTEITELEPSTQYEIQVAAVNSAGIGPFTTISLIADTTGELINIVLGMHVNILL